MKSDQTLQAETSTLENLERAIHSNRGNMKVKICWTQEVSDDFRRHINQYFGKDGLATRKEVKHWFYMHGQMMNDDLADQKDESETQEDQS